MCYISSSSMHRLLAASPGSLQKPCRVTGLHHPSSFAKWQSCLMTPCFWCIPDRSHKTACIGLCVSLYVRCEHVCTSMCIQIPGVFTKLRENAYDEKANHEIQKLSHPNNYIFTSLVHELFKAPLPAQMTHTYLCMYTARFWLCWPRHEWVDKAIMEKGTSLG